jgi:hypothetical protein
MRRTYLWVALATAPGMAACAGLFARGAPSVATASLAPDSGARVASADGGAPPRSVSPGDDSCSANLRQTRHHVDFKTIARDVARLTVTRDFEARDSSKPVCVSPDIALPVQSVVESFELQTDGAWRQGRLEIDPGGADPTPSASGGPQDRPWASFGGTSGHDLQTPAFRPRGTVQIRYTVWAQGELGRGGRRWIYCDSDNEGTVVPEIVVAPGDSDIAVRPDAESPWCVDIEKTEAPGTALSARFGTYRLTDGWWWRLELSAPKSLTKAPTLPEDAPVVFVLDASRSMQRRGGIGPQLAIARAYLANTPRARVEFVLTNRTAERMFGHFVPIAELEAALAARLPGLVLKNGSFLDRGAELAADVLVHDGRPGRIILMTDGELRSRFNQGATVTTLRRAPSGTLVHLLYPGYWSTTSNRMHHLAPEGLSGLSAALGGASYGVDVDTRAASSAELATLLERLVSPDRIESLALRDLQTGEDWPDPLEGAALEDELRAGDGQTASGFSTKRPPGRLALAGSVWGKKVEVQFQHDLGFERDLPRMATSDRSLMECHDPAEHTRRALRERFLAPGLRFWVAGSGVAEEGFSVGMYDDCDDHGLLSGRGSGSPMPKPADLPPDVGTALASCHLVPNATGILRIKLETEGIEIVDVTAQGGDAEDRRCAEEALWAVGLPEDFNPKRWVRTEYAFALSRIGLSLRGPP